MNNSTATFLCVYMVLIEVFHNIFSVLCHIVDASNTHLNTQKIISSLCSNREEHRPY